MAMGQDHIIEAHPVSAEMLRSRLCSVEFRIDMQSLSNLVSVSEPVSELCPSELIAHYDVVLKHFGDSMSIVVSSCSH